MKLFLMGMILAAGSVGFASQSFVATEHTCSELNSRLQAEGSLTLINRFGSSTYVSETTACGVYEEAVPTYEPSQDEGACFVGYWCKKVEGY